MPVISGPGGGGSSPFSVLGPYSVSHTNLDPVSYYDVAPLDDGTIVWRVAVYFREAFTAPNERVQVQLGLTTGSAQFVLADVYADAPYADDGSDTADPTAARETRTHFITDYNFPVSWVGLAKSGAHLLAADIVGGNTAGIADIYALVSLPS